VIASELRRESACRRSPTEVCGAGDLSCQVYAADFSLEGRAARTQWEVSWKFCQSGIGVSAGERVLRSEVAKVQHPLQEPEAVEVIDLLHDAGVKPSHRRSIARRAHRALVAAGGEPRNQHAHHGNDRHPSQALVLLAARGVSPDSPARCRERE